MRLRLNDTELLEKYDDDYFRDVIVNGQADTPMEGFAADLTEEEITALVNLIKTWQ